MSDEPSPRAAWVTELDAGPSSKELLARVVDGDGGRDDAENEPYEHAADPQRVQLERERRRYRGAYFRRLRRRPEQL